MKPHHGDPDQALDCFAQCARPQTSTRLAPRSVRRASGTPAKFAGYQANFLGLGRGLFGPNQALDRPSFTEIEFITT